MVTTTLVVAAAVLQTALALSSPQQQRATAVAAAATTRNGIIGDALGAVAVLTAASISSSSVANAAPPEVIRIDADVPALIQVAKSNKDVILKLATEVKDAVKISQFPDNLAEFARDAAAGDVLLNLNGIPIDVSLLSEKGGVDVNLSTEKADVSFTVTSPYLPKLPLLSKRVVPLTVTTEEIAVQEVDRLQAAKDSGTTKEPKERSFVQDTSRWLDEGSSLDVFHRGWTNQAVLGWTSLSVGVSYFAAYYTYLDEQDKAEQESKAKAATAAEKRRKDAAAAAAKKKSPKKEKKSEEKVKEKRFTILSPEERAVAAILQQDDEALKTLPPEFTVPASNAVMEKKKRSWYKLWLA